MVARAFTLAMHQHQGPTHGQIKVALEELHKASDKLMGFVSTLDDATLRALLRQHGEFREAYFAEAESQSERREIRVLRIVSALSAEAKAAITEVNEPHPLPNESPLDWIIDWEPDDKPVIRFVSRLASIFKKFTKKKPKIEHDRIRDTYSGDFLSFVEACITTLENGRRKALGRTVDYALQEWRNARDTRA